MKISFNKSGKIGLLAVLITCTCSCHINARKADKELTGYAVFQKYMKATGGEQSLRNVKTYFSIDKSYINNRHFCTTTTYIHYPDKLAIQYVYNNGLVVGYKLNGNKAVKIGKSDSIQKLQGEEQLQLEKMAYIFPDLYYIDNKYNFKIENKNKNEYEIKISKGKFSVYYYIDKSTFLCKKVKYKNTITYPIKDTIISGIRLVCISKAILTSRPTDTMVTINQFYKINPKINDTIFDIK